MYETKDGKIGILDYKNTKSEKKHLKKYKMQLYTYILGLRDESNKFKDKEIGELSIYAIQSKKLVNIPINDEEINNWESEINETVLNIENKNFSSIKGKPCINCQYLEICK